MVLLARLLLIQPSLQNIADHPNSVNRDFALVNLVPIPLHDCYQLVDDVRRCNDLNFTDRNPVTLQRKTRPSNIWIYVLELRG